jgi:amino acid adenylation domain-containing protein
VHDATTRDSRLAGYGQQDPPAGRPGRSRHRQAASQCLPDLLRQQARGRPNAVAVRCGDSTLTFAGLAARAAGLAGHLRQLGVTPDDRVGVFAEPSADLIASIWGVLCAGGAYVPLSPEYPVERLRFMIADCGARVVITQPELAALLAELVPQGTKIVSPVPEPAPGDDPGGEPPAVPGLTPESLAYVIYTSGSTGKPKGVMIEHRSIVSQLRWLRRAYELDARATVLHKTPMSFDAAQWEILAPACGAALVVSPPGAYRDPEALIDTIVRTDVTALQCVPTLLQALLDTGDLDGCKSLTQVFSGGEVLTAGLARRFFEVLPDCQLVNLYGPTECTINASACTVDRDALGAAGGVIPIGTPVPGTRFHILDPKQDKVAVGQVGELYIGGVQLARGYVGRPDLDAERFLRSPFSEDGGQRLYRTGDLAYWNADGTAQFAGRTDNQVKLRGFRVELDEIRLAIEAHDWVRNAAVIVRQDGGAGYPSLVAFVALNPREAALMDQGAHGAHHQSKQSRLQIRAQLSNAGLRLPRDLRGLAVELPGKAAPASQRRLVFARKSYRFFEGGTASAADILALLGRDRQRHGSRDPGELSRAQLGEILRYFGQFASGERLLPKYGYASPGALYATQLYLELSQVAAVPDGLYYYHPVHHQLIRVAARPAGRTAGQPAMLRAHFVGKKSAIEPVYKKNIREVLEIETGHMIGLLEEILPGYGLDVGCPEYAPEIAGWLRGAPDDYYLGSFGLVSYGSAALRDTLAVYVQAHPGGVAGLSAGQYRYRDGTLTPVSGELIQKRHVVAINQEVYERAGFGISLVGGRPEDWMSYIDLGRELQRLQMNDLGLGFMSAGYSSRTGDDLPSALRIEEILQAVGEPEAGPSYFFLGGRVSDEQVAGEGMKEDLVHMKGPTEMIRDDLITMLPDYMMPSRVIVLGSLPLLPSGKVDRRALEEACQAAEAGQAARPFTAPRTGTERAIGAIWAAELKQQRVSVRDDFFEAGGNSLIAVRLISRINAELGRALPMQVLFESPTIEKLARRADRDGSRQRASRLVPLQPAGLEPPVYCWPGLGGFVMNLRPLAGLLDPGRPCFGVQTHGINPGEIPYASIEEMAAADVALIRQAQPRGPYTLWGYSFGARVAYESSRQLERDGEQVRRLFLIAPGMPGIAVPYGSPGDGDAAFRDRGYLTILFSVFAGAVSGPLLDECLRVVTDADGFAEFIRTRLPGMDAAQVRRIIAVVHRTYRMNYELAGRGQPASARQRVHAPVTVFRASGDEPSFAEQPGGDPARAPLLIDLEADHYGALTEPGVGELAARIREQLRDA